MTLAINSAEYHRKNKRRWELIQKKVRASLSAEEEAEFEHLQTEILKVTSEAFPHPSLPGEEVIQRLEKKK